MSIRTIKIQTAMARAIPMLSELFLLDAVTLGDLPDPSHYLLKESPPIKKKVITWE